ncbi:hypothetical protein BSAF29S_02362 [Bacillus safensis subsp. safensis]
MSFTAFDEIAIIYLQITVKRLHQRVRELFFMKRLLKNLTFQVIAAVIIGIIVGMVWQTSEKK